MCIFYLKQNQMIIFEMRKKAQVHVRKKLFLAQILMQKIRSMHV
jgi:hypothetical protein